MIISKLVVLRYLLRYYYYHSQSIYVYDNIMNFHSFLGIQDLYIQCV